MALVRLEGVTKKFGEVLAVKDVNLLIPDGEFVVLVGPSGCGKTTTLRMIAGLEVPTQGKLSIGNRDVTVLHPRERNVAMVFQDYALYPHMTVEENLSFGLKNLKYPEPEIRQRVAQAAEMLQITPLLKRKPRELSGGQRQRVALGRAITRRPEVFLFDEPLSNLDAKLRVSMRVELAELHQRLGTTVVYVTHDQVEAMTLGSRIVVMNHGVIQQVGTALDLYNSPDNLFVAEFLGSPPINLIPVELRTSDGQSWLVNPDFQLPLTPQQSASLTATRANKLILAIRPENIRLVDQSSPSSDQIRIVVRPKVIETLGSFNLIYFDVAGVLWKASLSPEVQAHIGEPLPLALALSRALIFDAETGSRIALDTPRGDWQDAVGINDSVIAPSSTPRALADIARE